MWSQVAFLTFELMSDPSTFLDLVLDLYLKTLQEAMCIASPRQYNWIKRKSMTIRSHISQSIPL